MAGPLKPIAWVLIAVAASCLLCTVGAMGVVGLGLLADDEPPPASARPGTSGGFSLQPPADFKPAGPGRFSTTWKKGDETFGVEVIHLAALPGLDDPEGKLARSWLSSVGHDWSGVSEAPLVMRRFVSNGARAYFTSAELHPKQGGTLARVTLLLVEADDRLEPLVFIQTYFDPGHLAVTQDMFATMSWPTSHPQVEAVLAGVQGSPVGSPLVTDDEVAGRWIYDTASSLQWVHTLTGATSMTAVAYAVRYELGEDHHYRYQFSSASGRVGAQQFGADSAEGTWAVEHDVLVLTPQSGKVDKYLLVGAPRTPQGKRGLWLLPHPHWSLSPASIAGNGWLFSEQ